MPRLYFALDLKDDAALIEEYERWHRPENIWPEVLAGLKAAGVMELEIFRCGNRLMMVMDDRPVSQWRLRPRPRSGARRNGRS